MIYILRSSSNQPLKHFPQISTYFLFCSFVNWLSLAEWKWLYMSELQMKHSSANWDHVWWGNRIPTLQAWISACKCPHQSQSRWMKTGCWGSYDTVGILLGPWMRPSRRCPNQETACMYEPKIWSQQFKGKIPRHLWWMISHKCDKDSDFMEMVKMKPAGSLQKKLPLKLLPNRTVRKVPWRGWGGCQKITGWAGRGNMHVSKSCQNSMGSTAYAVS